MEFLSKSLEETAKIAKDFSISINKPAPTKSFGEAKATIIGLYGELGSGKTTFMKYLAESLGVKDTIQSPTFVIMKIYDLTPGPSPFEGEGGNKEELEVAVPPHLIKGRGLGGGVFEHLIHIDAYRIERDEEMLNLGWRKIISDSKNLICIEWPERIAKIMPEHIMIKFEHVSETKRKISIA